MSAGSDKKALLRFDAQAPLHRGQETSLAKLSELLENAKMHAQDATIAELPFSLAMKCNISHQTIQEHLVTAKLNPMIDAEIQSKHLQYYHIIQRYDELLGQVVDGLANVGELISDLSRHYRDVSKKTSLVNNECQEMLDEQNLLLESADRFAAHLHYFHEADRISTKLRSQLGIQRRGSTDNSSGNLSSMATSQSGIGGSSSLAHSNPLASSALSTELPLLLQSLDQCIKYMTTHVQILDAGRYLSIYNRLSSQIMLQIKDHFAAQLQITAATIRASLKTDTPSSSSNLPSSSSSSSSSGDSSSSSSSTDPSLASVLAGPKTQTQLKGGSSIKAYVESRSAVMNLAPLVQSIEDRALNHDTTLYGPLLNELLRVFRMHRRSLLIEDVASYLRHLLNESAIDTSSSEPAPSQALTSLTRQCVNYILEVCNQEYQLFYELFTFSEVGAQKIDETINDISEELYTFLRPLVIHQTDSLDTLCELVIILKQEVLEQVLPTRGASVVSCAASISRLLQDVQEKLAYLAQLYIRDEIELYQDTLEDLVYPKQSKNNNNNNVPSHSANNRSSPSGDMDGIGTVDEKGPISSHNYWHPVLHRTLLCLSKLARCLEPNVFRVLAQKAVSVCTSRLSWLSEHLTKRSGATIGLLFFIRHLLDLSQQIAPFQVDFAVTEQSLDFSHMKEIIPGLLGRKTNNNEATLSPSSPSSSTSSAAYNNARNRQRSGGWRSWLGFIIQEGTPQLSTHTNDAKKDLETKLKVACESFIASQTRVIVGPLMDFFQRITESGAASPKSTPGTSLSELAEIVQTMTALQSNVSIDDDDSKTGVEVPGNIDDEDNKNDSNIKNQEGNKQASSGLSTFRSQLIHLRNAIRMHVENPVTEAILFKPIQRTLNETLQQLRLYVETSNPNAPPNDTSDDGISLNSDAQTILSLKIGIAALEEALLAPILT